MPLTFDTSQGDLEDGLSKSITFTSVDGAITLPAPVKPVVNTFTAPATSTTLAITGITVTASATNGTVAGYLINESTTAPAATDSGWVATAPTSYTATSQGSKTLNAWVKDSTGNVSLSKTAVVLVDTTAPVVSVFTIPATATSLTVSITTLTASDETGGSGLAGYLITESATAPAASAAGWNATKPGSYIALSAGAKTLYAWVKDAAGNVSLSKSAPVTITIPDLTAPIVTAFTIPATSTTPTVVITTLTATDEAGGSGLASYLITETATPPLATATGWTTTATPPASYTITASISQGVATSKTLYAWAKDGSNNVSASKSASVTVTLTGPSLTISATTLANGTATKNSALSLSGTVTGLSPTLTVTQNGGTPAVLTPGTGGSFSTAIVLATGDNTIVTKATDATGTTTDTRVITLNPALADLNVSAPTDGSFLKDNFVAVTGSLGAPQSTTLTLTLNGAAPVAVPLTGDNFSTTVNLVSGPNTIVLTATDTETTPASVHTKTLGVVSDGTAPTLSVSSPAAAFATPQSSVTLSGSAIDAETVTLNVTVNGTALASQPALGADGSFSTSIPLPTFGSYAIVVTATDQSGNSSSVTRNVVRGYPSGNVADGVSAPTVADALKVLNFALGLATPSASEKVNADVAPLVSGKPAPNGSVDGADALVILEKIVGTVAW
jgi:hypothetical protein